MKKKIIVIAIILTVLISTILIVNQTQYKEVIETSIDTFYLTNNGNVYVKGENVDGELGLGHTNPVEKPTKVTTLKNIEKIIVQTVGAIEDRDIYFISKDGEVYVSGINDSGQLGLGHNNNVTLATKITALEGIKIKNVIEANNSDGKSSKYYLAENGDVYVSGENDLGQLGLGHTNNINIATKIPTLKDIKDIVTSGESTYYLTNEGKVYVSGANDVGQLGVGDRENVTQPTLVKDLEDIVVEKIEVELFYDYTENLYTKNANVYYTTDTNEIYVSGSGYGIDLSQKVLDGYGEVVEPSNTINYLLLKQYGYDEEIFKKYYFNGIAMGDSPNYLMQESNFNNTKYTEPLNFDLAMVKESVYEETNNFEEDLENFAKLLKKENNNTEIYEVLNGFSIMNGNYEDYANNARAKKIQVTINDEIIKTFELKNTEEVQLFDLNYKQTDISKPINVKMEVLEIYEGKVSNDVYITDIGFGIESFGFGGR